MLVYEYVDNGNLEQWLHGDVGPQSPLTWDIRMNIILGMAKGYLLNKIMSTIVAFLIFFSGLFLVLNSCPNGGKSIKDKFVKFVNQLLEFPTVAMYRG